MPNFDFGFYEAMYPKNKRRKKEKETAESPNTLLFGSTSRRQKLIFRCTFSVLTKYYIIKMNYHPTHELGLVPRQKSRSEKVLGKYI